MPQQPKHIIKEDGVDFSRHNMDYAKEEKEDTARANKKNFDYNAKRNLKR